MTPEQFFDELDKVFGCDDGYVNHLQRIKELKWKLIETQGALAFQQEYVDGDKEALKKEIKEVKEGLAQKFYDHYGGQGADTLNFARQTGPDLGNMVDYVLKENKELKEQVEDAHQKGFDAGREEYQVDQEFLDEKDKEIEKLNEQVETLQYQYDMAIQIDNKEIFHLKEEVNEALEQVKELKEQVEELEEELEQKDAHWNDWLNNEFGDELYPISPSPEPDEFVDKVKKLKEQVEELKEQVEENTTYAVLPEEGQFLNQLKELQEKYDHLRSVHSQVVQDLNARTEQVVELTLQHE